MESENNNEVFNPEEEYEYITNYFGLKLSNEEKEFVVDVLKNEEYTELFKNNNPSYIIIKFLQENKNIDNFKESFNAFSLKFNNKLKLNSLFLDSLDKQPLYEYDTIFISDIYRKRLGKEKIDILEFQKRILEIEEDIKIYSKGINKGQLRKYSIFTLGILTLPIGAMVFDKIELFYFIWITYHYGIEQFYKIIDGKNKISSTEDFEAYVKIIKQSMNQGEGIPIVKENAIARVKGLLEKIRI